MKNKFIYFALCLIITFNVVNAQVVFNISNSPSDTIPCNNNCIALHTEHLDIRETTHYTIASIPYNPIAGAGLTSLSLQDDTYSDSIAIGFDFCFYGNTYHHLVLSSNGQVTFNLNYANGTCSFNTQQTLPYFNTEFPDNAIFIPFVDFNILSGGNIRYQTIGSAPFRKFIVNYDSLAYFGGNCTSDKTTAQCVLSETYNTIELFISNKPLCNSNPLNWLNYATIGIQSSWAMQSLTAPSRHASIWSASQEAWKFTPDGSSAAHVTWYNENNQILSSGPDSFLLCSSYYPRTIHAKVQYACSLLQDTDTITIVKVLPSIDSVVVTPSTCQNTNDGSIQVYASSYYPPIAYQLDYGIFSANNLFSNVNYGLHTIVIYDSIGCTDSMLTIVNTNSTLNATINMLSPAICPNNLASFCAQITGGVPPYNYYWNTGDTTLCLTNVGLGIYTFYVIDSIGCIDSVTIQNQNQNYPLITYQISKAICNANGSIQLLTVYGGVPPYSFLWSTGATTQSVYGLVSGNYWVIVSDSLGCSYQYLFYVNDTLVTQATSTVLTPSTCGFSNGSLKMIGYNAIAPYTYQWSTGDTTSIINNVAPGNYSCVITDATGCSTIKNITLFNSNPLTIQFSKSNAHCDLLNNGSALCMVQNAMNPITYQWSTGSTLPVLYSLTPGWYSVHVTDANGCEAIDSLEIGNDGSPHIQILNYTPPLCYGGADGSITFDGLGGAPPYKYSLDGITFTTNGILTGISAGIYTVYIRDANSCLRDSVIHLTQPSALIIDSTKTKIVSCFSEELADFECFVSGGISPYEFSLNGGTWQTTNLFAQLPEGIYTITVKDAHSCTLSYTYFHPILRPSEPLRIVFSSDQVSCYKINTGMIEANILGGWPPYNVQWDSIETNSLVLNNLYPGKYILSVQDSMQCSITDSIYLEQENCCTVYMPNAFSPNADGLNDYFNVISAHDFQDMQLRIYNRWGELLFTSYEKERGWDGKYKSKDADSGTYFYMLNYICNTTKKAMMMKGDFILIR
ncbi:MAG: gliding motility-associated C-terminal domain-containing protein [Chitinophagaceae bacterium]|nr:gliding motility-associated C-terminal domain-containing protein [Chitinophagaceae bacterium]